MNYAYDLSGGAPVMRKFQSAVAHPDAGVPVVNAKTGTPGVGVVTTTAAINVVGLTLDTVTAPDGSNDTGSTGSDPSRFISLVINPDGCYRVLLAGSATEGAALPLQTITLADAAGDDLTTLTFIDEAVVWGFSGANVGQYRKIQTTAGNVDVAFRYDTVVGDEFLQASGCFPAADQHHVVLTTLLTEINAEAALDSTAENYRIVEVDLRDSSDSGRTNSHVIVKPGKHCFGNTTVFE